MNTPQVLQIFGFVVPFKREEKATGCQLARTLNAAIVARISFLGLLLLMLTPQRAPGQEVAASQFAAAPARPAAVAIYENTPVATVRQQA